MSDRLVRAPDNAEELAELEAAGYAITNDDEFVAAFARHFGFSESTARRTLTATSPDELDDVVTVVD